jgi:hypothetical protein
VKRESRSRKAFPIDTSIAQRHRSIVEASGDGTDHGVNVMSVWIYVDTSRQVGDAEHLRVFASEEAANDWFAIHDPEGVAFRYEVIEAPVRA